MDLNEFREKLIEEKANATYDELSKKYGINKFYLCRMVHDRSYLPPLKICARLGIKTLATVVVIAGEVPAGSQALTAQQCPCGQWFISNHPQRKKCFVHSPYKGKKGKP